jgi:hypothetical protein
VLPSHPVVPTGGTAATDAPRGRILTLVVTGLVLGVAAAASDRTTGLALAVVVIALGAAAVVARRGRRAAARRGPGHAATSPTFPAADYEFVTPDELTERLRALYDDHVEQVNMALSEDREDLVQELSDSYMDQALHLITAGARPSSDSLPLL